MRRSTNRSTPCPLPSSLKVTELEAGIPASGRAGLWSSQAVSRTVIFLPDSSSLEAAIAAVAATVAVAARPQPGVQQAERAREPTGSAGSSAERPWGGLVSTGYLAGPLRHLAAQLDELRPGNVTDTGPGGTDIGGWGRRLGRRVAAGISSDRS